MSVEFDPSPLERIPHRPAVCILSQPREEWEMDSVGEDVILSAKSDLNVVMRWSGCGCKTLDARERAMADRKWARGLLMLLVYASHRR